MKKIIIITLLLWGASVLDVNAQTRFKDGYIITLKNDTVYCQLGNQSDYSCYKSCRYLENDVKKIYLPGQILEFGYLGGKSYSSDIVNGAFVEVLIKGEIDLYRYKKTYYVCKNKGKVYKLEAKIHKVNADDINGERKDNRWKGILAYLISDEIENPHKHLKRLSLSEEMLKDLILRYNRLKNSDIIVYKANLPKSKLYFGVTMGMAKSSIDLLNYPEAYTFLPESYSSTYPILGLAFEYLNPRLSDRVAMQAEVIYSKLNSPDNITKKHDETYITEGHYLTYRINVGYTSITLPLSIKYYLLKRKYSPFVQVGGIYGYVATGGLEYSVDERSTKRQLFDFNNNQFGYLLGVGISRSFKSFKVSANMRYQKMCFMRGSNDMLTFSIIVLKI